jgi:predicted nucleic-acid-binding Zn-ribbon protein
MIDPHEYAERCVKGRSHETQKQRIASTENLIRAIQLETLQWAAEECAKSARRVMYTIQTERAYKVHSAVEVLELMRVGFKHVAAAIERGTYHRSEK